MSGKCYSCATSFGFFKKEVGCKNCGFAFCKDCLSKKAPVPKHKNEIHKVCNNCYGILTGGAAKSHDPSKYSPPEAYKKRMAALEKKSDGHAPQKKESKHKTTNNYKGMNKEDIAIAERLQKLKDERKKEAGPIPTQSDIERRLQGLKEDRPAPPSSEDMATRLAQLKGQDPASVNKPHVFKKDTRGEQQQIDNLLEEIRDEVEIDSYGVNPVTDVQERLDHLKGKETAVPQPGQSTVNAPQVSSDYKSGSGEDLDINEMNKLMAQVATQMDLDARKAIAGMEKDKELMSRLNQLKQERKARQNKNTENGKTDDSVEQGSSELNEKYAHLQPEFSDSEDEEEAIKRVLKQSLQEVAIDEAVEASGYAAQSSKHSSNTHSTSPANSTDKVKKKHKKEKHKTEPPKKKDESDEEISESDEFPWCCICNEDATLKCIGCDYDLYCKRCFKEGHDKLDLQDHKSFPFSPKKSKQTR